MKPNWTLSDFNDKGQLRIPIGLALVMVFLSRHLLLLLMGGVSRFVGAGGTSLSSTVGLPPVWMLPISLLGLLLLGLVLNRDRFAAKPWWRNVMKRLIPTVQLLTVVQLVLSVVLNYQAILRMEPVMLIELALLIGCLVYLQRDPKPRYFAQECAGVTVGKETG